MRRRPDGAQPPVRLERKRQELARAKRKAGGLLALAAAVFLGTMLLPPNPWVLAVRAVAEAAMVGGLADWFAVSALFRRIPTGIPFITAHTDIIPRSKDRIADNLSAFVQEKFLAPSALVALIRSHDPSRYVAQWLADPANAVRIGDYLARAAEGALHLVEEARVERLVRDAAREVLKGVDLTASLRGLLDMLTSDGRHAQLLEQALERALRLLERPQTREWIAAQVIEWLVQEHPRKQKVLPRQWIAQIVAAALADALTRRLESIRDNPAHVYRALFDQWIRDFVLRLQSDPALHARGEEIKQYLLDDDALGAYVATVWRSFKDWLAADLRDPRSVFRRGATGAATWLGGQLMQDEALRQSLREQLEEAATRLAPEFADYLTRHVRDTVRAWDARELAEQVELNIGKDLQAIRVNGTIVGGAIGLVLHLLTWLAGGT